MNDQIIINYLKKKHKYTEQVMKHNMKLYKYYWDIIAIGSTYNKDNIHCVNKYFFKEFDKGVLNLSDYKFMINLHNVMGELITCASVDINRNKDKVTGYILSRGHNYTMNLLSKKICTSYNTTMDPYDGYLISVLNYKASIQN